MRRTVAAYRKIIYMKSPFNILLLILSFYNSGNRFYTNTELLTRTHTFSECWSFFLALLWCGFVLFCLAFFLAKPEKMCLVFFFIVSKSSILFGPFWSRLTLIFCIPKPEEITKTENGTYKIKCCGYNTYAYIHKGHDNKQTTGE